MAWRRPARTTSSASPAGTESGSASDSARAAVRKAWAAADGPRTVSSRLGGGGLGAGRGGGESASRREGEPGGGNGPARGEARLDVGTAAAERDEAEG